MSNWGTTPKLPDLLGRGDRNLTYQQAIAEAMRQALAADERVRVFGEGATDKAGTYGTTKDLHVEFGPERVFDVPTAEGIITGHPDMPEFLFEAPDVGAILAYLESIQER